MGDDRNWADPRLRYEEINVLNRFAWFDQFAQAYRASGDETYARAFVADLLDWISKNPAYQGQPWRSLEVGIRGQVWTTAYNNFLHSRALPMTCKFCYSSRSCSTHDWPIASMAGYAPAIGR